MPLQGNLDPLALVAGGAREFIVKLPSQSSGKVVASPRRGGFR
jgi:hypothetical protein